LCLQDTELRYVRINERLAAINGQSVEAHIGRTLWEVIPEIATTVGPIMRGVLESGEPVLDLEVQVATPAEPDIERHWLTSYYPLTSPDGAALGVSVVVQDISEVKWAEGRARRHLEDLAHVSRLSTMGQMATGIAHELNQPLASIANYAFAGQQTIGADAPADAEPFRKMFDELLAQALRAGEIVQHLRAFVNKAPHQRVTTSVNALIGDVLALMAAEFRLSGVHPGLALDAEFPHVVADAIQVQQVILNLVHNALDAMRGVAPSMRNLTITSTTAGKLVEVAVRDSGKGVSTDNLDQVFDSFYTTKGEGMGMGLAISRSIVEAHGGRLWAEANPDKGMTFRFTLPGAQADAGTDA
jgi:two-component system sensor kinase FixL